MSYFVMINGGGNIPLPLIDEDDSVLLFSSREAAYEAARRNPLGQARGYAVYKWEY
jgi:hypothetical protein